MPARQKHQEDQEDRPTEADEPDVLVIAACGGQRCAALQRLEGDADGVVRAEVRAAVRAQPRGVLLTTGCQGPCHLGGVATVGWATVRSARMRWRSRPVMLTETHCADRASALAQGLRGATPQVGSLLRRLRRQRSA